ncbi:CatA-like O-acetyltransferase [Myroides marinus]|uniref:CatA-like O-acetyltransferase n=1 Tax=Myroides marinus TaxID=703342 RepID=UPI002577FF22|nr:CatA-like O-acetyltransferase [Myroides marinus]MDM1362407.1 type A chloramphenicol O-acetyltransferase [Myroides marinus]MDM1369716.1 type A chloramphenicol O-acetyltransferase [Myroides marinus]MDM1376728.1 type A chloramphenicol O-acetyltransferase [Myroides marinus]MDM1384081.1 type A chloramphenicol O-acetyltransferase [Myroides marinus]MDM1405361.1 type A chloramphenicol O-acetyltransferase [Myroides marinus]
MNYQKFDIENWNRKEHFYHFKDQLRCGFSLTTKIDISQVIPFIKEHGYKFYPTIIYLISKAVNKQQEFKLAMKDNELIEWDTVNPAYTIMHTETETFSELCSMYTDNLKDFLKEYDRVQEKYKGNYAMSPQTGIENIFHISMIPWVSFDGFNLNVPGFGDYFAPIFTLGKYTVNKDEVLMPISIQVHHATCDGLHVSKLLNSLQEYCNSISEL